MTKDEALKLALEALEFSNANHWWGSSSIEKAITAIKEALAQPEPEYLAFMDTPQRKPLTAMEVYDVVHDADLDWHTGFALGEDENRFVVFARAIEAAHGIKGEA